MIWRAAALLLAIAPTPGWAERGTQPAQLTETVPEHLLPYRYANYLEACSEHDGTLIDGQAAPAPEGFKPPRTAGTPPDLAKYYTDKIAKKGLSGTALVGFVVDTRGRVTWVKLIATSNHEELDLAAMRLVKDIRFYKTATLSGERVPVYMTVPVAFRVLQ